MAQLPSIPAIGNDLASHTAALTQIRNILIGIQAAGGQSVAVQAGVTAPPSSVPVGTEISMRSSLAPAGFIGPMAGQLLSRHNYPDLWTWAQAGSRVVTDANWGIGTPPDKGAFSSGDGSTTFRLPDPRGLFERVMDGGAGVDPDTASRNPAGASVVGSQQDDRMQGHYHNKLSAAFITNQNVVYQAGTSASGGTDLTTGSPASDGTHGTPRVSSETRPQNYYVNRFIKY